MAETDVKTDVRVEIPEDHWLGTIDNEKFTPDVQKALLKYETQEDAILGGYEAQKTTGKPFKLPESLDKLDDKSKEEFMSNLNKLRGVPSKIEDLKDINFVAGLPEGQVADEGLKAAFSQFVVEKKLSKADAQAGIEWFNTMTVNHRKQQDVAYAAQVKASEVELAKPERFGSHEKYLAAVEVMKRMFANTAEKIAKAKGMTPEQLVEMHENAGKYLVETKSLFSPDFVEIMATIAADYGEGETHGGEGGGKPKEKPKTQEEITIEESPKTAKALNWTT